MDGDLVADGSQVHEAARDVLDFWFGLTKEQHFAKDEGLDRTIAARFGPLRDRVLASGAAAWRESGANEVAYLAETGGGW